MNLQFSQLGSLYQGELDLSGLTIICGENNTGKTYVTYALYGLLKLWQSFAELEPTPKELESLEETGVLSIDLQAKIDELGESLKAKLSQRYLKNLHEILASKASFFEETEISLNFDINNDWQKKKFYR